MPRTCTVCRHSKRDEIDAALIERRPFRDIARQFGPSKDALVRHRYPDLYEVVRARMAEMATAVTNGLPELQAHILAMHPIEQQTAERVL